MYDIDQRDDASIIQVSGELDIVSARSLASAILAESWLEKSIIVSLKDCGFCDSNGLAVFENAKNRLGARLQIVVPPESRIRRVFNITGLTERLALCESIDEAIAKRDTKESIFPGSSN